MSRHSQKEVARIKRIAASADFGKPMNTLPKDYKVNQQLMVELEAMRAHNKELREALQLFLEGTEWVKPEHFTKARAALAKATP